MQQLTQPGDDTEQKEIKPAPEFQARYKVKNLFARFADEFTEKTHNSGVELHWIGIGTWESRLKIVPKEHLDAWIRTQENLKNDSPEAMNKVGQTAVVEKMKELIEKVPLGAFENIITAMRQAKRYGKQTPKKKEKPKTETMEEDEDTTFSAEEMKEFLEFFHDLREEKRGNDRTGEFGSRPSTASPPARIQKAIPGDS